MSSHSARRAVMAVAILAALVAPIAAVAQDATVPSAIIPVSNSPATIQSCRVVKANDYRNSWTAVMTIGNRTKHSLIAMDAQFIAYDSEGAKISQVGLHFGGFDPVATRDTGVINANLLFDLAAIANNPTLLAKVSCRVLGAQFTGNMKWTLGATWPEPLLSIEAATMVPSGGGQGAGPIAAPPAATPKFSIAVTNSWNDVFPSGMLIHDTLTITGGDVDAQLRPTDLVLTMTLPGGAKKQYPGLAAPAPQYQKIVPGVGTTMAYEVAPAADLGRLGMIVIPAHSSVVTTVTFGLTDQVQTPTDNRAVTVR